jgi:hypothetical protein
MKNSNRFVVLALTFLLGAIVAFAQGGEKLAGKYTGTVKAAAGAAEEKIALELKSEGEKIKATLMRTGGTLEATEVTLKDGALTLAFGKDVVLTAKKVDDNKMVGELATGANKRPVELARVLDALAAAPAAVNLNGSWDAVADANGQPFPFVLTLKVEGETVTGSSSSQLGDAALKQGSWKNGQLAFQLDSPNGVISMSATVVEGKLSGEFDVSGQFSGKWVAVKKN